MLFGTVAAASTEDDRALRVNHIKLATAYFVGMAFKTVATASPSDLFLQ